MAHEEATSDAPAPETATVRALVTLTVAPKEGQTPVEAAAEMLRLFTAYLTEREGVFLTDYGTTVDELGKFRSGELDDSPTWGGYEGPYVLESKVEALA